MERERGSFVTEDYYRLRVIRLESGEIEIQANRAGLRDLAKVCKRLSELTDEQAATSGPRWIHKGLYATEKQPWRKCIFRGLVPRCANRLSYHDYRLTRNNSSASRLSAPAIGVTD